MKICFFGSSLVSSYWNGAATYYRGMLKEIAALGHEVTFYEPDAFERQAHRDIEDPDWARVVVYPATADGWRRSVDAAARSADMLVKASGVGVFDQELEIAIAESPSRAIRPRPLGRPHIQSEAGVSSSARASTTPSSSRISPSPARARRRFSRKISGPR